MLENQSCGECVFWDKIVSSNVIGASRENVAGFCRANPPTPVVRSIKQQKLDVVSGQVVQGGEVQQVQASFPVMAASDKGCRLFEKGSR